ncbi:hypothetical protein VNO80_25267 [Phaseolus coccineus]|uniref:Uncharacterized protein n=1 Tax=Phaseolus coccineus TaxID=3886 RepID=A0AAN9QNL8_PHACN
MAKYTPLKEHSVKKTELEELKFDLSLKSLLNKDVLARRLQFLQKTSRTLGTKWEAWCEFHQACGHDTKRWICRRRHDLLSLEIPGQYCLYRLKSLQLCLPSILPF